MRLLVMLFLFLICFAAKSQSTFRSNVVSGDWDIAGTWIEDVPGTDPDGIPDSNDNVFIQVGHNINIPDGTDQRANNLDISRGDVTFLGASGFLRVTAAFTANSTVGTQSTITGTNAAHRFIITGSGSFSISSGSHLELNGVRLTVSGTSSTIAGELEINTTLGTTHTLIDITIANGGTWTVNTTDNFNIGGDFVNNSNNTFTPSSTVNGSIYTFNSASQTISGTGTSTFSRIRSNAPTIVTNNGNIEMTDDIIGTGTFINGATGVLELNNNATYAVTTLTLNTVGNTVRYIGGTNEVINIGPFYNLEIEMDNSTVICQVSGTDVSVEGSLTVIEGLARVQTANTLDVDGDLDVQGGEFFMNDIGAILNIGGNLEMSGGEIDINDGDINITGNVVLTGGAFNKNETTVTSTLDAVDFTASNTSIVLSEGEVTLTGDMIIGEGANLNMNTATSIVAITGSLDVTGTGLADLNNGTISFDDMEIGSGGTVELAANSTFTSIGTITVTNGTFTVDGAGTPTFNNISIGASGNWNVTAAYDPTINGNLHNIGTFTGCNNTGCDYTLTSATGTITGSAQFNNMSDIILNDGAIYTNLNTGGFNVTDRLETTSGVGTFINGANGYLLFGGANSNFAVTNFTASATGNTVEYNRTASNQLIQPTTDADNTYYNLVIDKAVGFDATMTSPIRVANNLTVNTGNLILGAQNLTLSAGATITNSANTASNYIQMNGAGNLVQEYSTTGATLYFPIGDVDDYSPINSLTISSATLGASPSITFSITDGVNTSRDLDNTGAGGDDDGTASTDYISRFWTLASNDIINAVFSATYTYVDADIIGTEANMIGTVYRTPIGQAFQDWSVEQAVNATNNLVTVTDVNAVSMGVLYAMDNTLNRLPVNLISYNATSTKRGINLDWTTSEEINNDYFEIERSVDGATFHSIAFVAGNGDSQELIDYTYLDQFPIKGRSYYRLKQTDFNGQFEYSEVISVVWSGDGNKNLNINIYPNPTNRNSLLQVSREDQNSNKALSWLLKSADGIVLKNGAIEAADFQLDISELSKGMYLFQVVANDGQSVTKKLIVN